MPDRRARAVRHTRSVQQAFEARQVVGGADDEDVADAREHQCTDGIIHHRFVVNGKQLLAHALGDGIQSGAGSSGENDTFHISLNLIVYFL